MNQKVRSLINKIKVNNLINNLINKIKDCALNVYQELGDGWNEEVYQKAMEVILREEGIDYERVLPITFRGKVVGKGYPDLIAWFKNGNKRIAIVIELKATQEIKEDHIAQVKKYIQELKKHLKENEEVYPIGFIFDFTRPSNSKIKDGFEDRGGLKILEVDSEM